MFFPNNRSYSIYSNYFSEGEGFGNSFFFSFFFSISGFYFSSSTFFGLGGGGGGGRFNYICFSSNNAYFILVINFEVTYPSLSFLYNITDYSLSLPLGIHIHPSFAN